ncbi:hypothetical protein [Streptomyces sp. CB02261]|uniref:hypothetical protein n=1 Tax=Streptomyces sp. CB02261 TaxID=1703940 RepID=UPI00093B3C69|nr:hypothetical protein [Streptomyces sp. CB02261]OKJ62452.1 hypothetical protein AMK29_20030 [Streptomyces sp. CB02261]
MAAAEFLVRVPEHLGELTHDRDFLGADAAAGLGRLEGGGHGVVRSKGEADCRGGEGGVEEFHAAEHHYTDGTAPDQQIRGRGHVLTMVIA